MDLDVISLLKDGTADLILWLVDIDFGSGSVLTEEDCLVDG